MIRRIPLSPSSVNYIVSQCGTNPIQFRYKDHISAMIFPCFTTKSLGGRVRKPTSADSYVEVVVPNEYIKKGRTYFTDESVQALDLAIEDLVKKRFDHEVWAKVQTGMKLKTAILLCREVFLLTEQDLPYDTIQKRIYRHKKRLEEAERQ